MPRELRADGAGILDSIEASAITAPTLLLVGSDSPRFARSDAELITDRLPDAEVAVLEGQGHIANYTAPQMLAEHLLGFLHPDHRAAASSTMPVAGG